MKASFVFRLVVSLVLFVTSFGIQPGQAAVGNTRPAAPAELFESPASFAPLAYVPQAAGSSIPCGTQTQISLSRIYMPSMFKTATPGQLQATWAAAQQAASAGPLIPADPAASAPPLDRSVATDIYSATQFLYTGATPVQTGVTAGTITQNCVTVLRGQTIDRDGQPMAGVAVTILDHPEFGQTLTRADGAFDLVINGGGTSVVVFSKANYLPAQRSIQTVWREYTHLDPVALIQLDSQVTTIDPASTADFQVARGTPQTDGDGTRQSTLLFAKGTTAEVNIDGMRRPLAELNVRATEYTVGDRGILAMPGDLPPTSGYTYAVEFTADEAGLNQVEFSQPVINYTENIIGAPVGGPVPTAYYDRQQAKWIPSGNGRVLKIISETGGMADLDVTGDGAADTGAALSALGITDAERQQLAGLYAPGQELWRVPVTHFTPWDHNWPYGPPPGAKPPQLKWFNGEVPDPCWTKGSDILCEAQILGESLPVSGTPFDLVYSSDRVPGWDVARTLDLPVTGHELPPELHGIRVIIEIAGRKFEQRWETPGEGVTSPPIEPDLTYHFTWDGLDAYGRPVQGRPLALIRLMYVYDFFYYGGSGDFYASFGQFGDTAQVFDGRFACAQPETRFFCGIPIEQTFKRNLGPWEIKEIDNLGGWSLSVHHSYDPGEVVLHKGDGSVQRSGSITVVSTAAGTGVDCDIPRFGCGDGGPAIEAHLDRPSGVAVAPDGTLYIADDYNGRVRRVGLDGMITTVAGTGEPCEDRTTPCGDSGPAIEAPLNSPQDVALGADGSLYISDLSTYKIRRVTPDGIISTVAGTGYECIPYMDACGDGGPALQADLNPPQSLAVGPDGSIYFAGLVGHRIRRIAPDGTITTVAGGGTFSEGLGDGGPANQAYLNAPHGISVSADGVLYIADSGNYRVRRVGADGIITTIAGGGSRTNFTGFPALEARLPSPIGVYAGQDNAIYFTTVAPEYEHIYRIDADGTLTKVAGSAESCYPDTDPCGDGGPANMARFNFLDDIVLAPDGSLYVADSFGNRIRRVSNGLASGFVSREIVDSDGSQVYVFDLNGRHSQTLDALTGVVRYTFSYDDANRLVGVTDAYGNQTHIERAADGSPTAIVAPGGQRTTLALDSNGYLASLTNPAGDVTLLSHAADGLLSSLSEPEGGLYQFTYDATGRLTRDEGPDGMFKELVRQEITNTLTVSVTTALSRTTVYVREHLPNGDTQRTVRQPSGAVTSVVIQADGTRVMTAPDGTVTTQVVGPDPRFKMKTPLTTVLTTEMPSGLTRQVLMGRQVLSPPGGSPLTVQVMTDTLTVTGRTSYSVFDAVARTITRTSPEGRRSVTQLDDYGRPVSIQLAEGLQPIVIAYDDKGRIASVQQGDQSMTYTYDAAYLLASSVDAGGRTTTYAHDAAGRLTSVTLPGSLKYEFTYDKNGRRTAVILPGGQSYAVNYTGASLDAGYAPPGSSGLVKEYDPDGALTKRTLADGRAVDVSYTPAGQPTGESYPEAQAAYAFDPLSAQLQSLLRTPVSLGGAQQIDLGYDGGLQNQMVYSGTVEAQYDFTYDQNLYLTGMELQSGADLVNTALTRNQDGLLTGYGPFTIQRGGPDGAQSAIGDGSLDLALAYDDLAQPSGRTFTVKGSQRYQVQLTYDNVGLLTQKVETIAGTSHTYTYTYDPLGQLLTVSKDGSVVETYTYDAHDNRTSRKLGNAAVQSASFDGQDRLTTQGGVAYTFDAAGQMTGLGADTFTYSARGELLQAQVGVQTITYSYDALRRRVARTDGSGTYQYLYGDPGNPFRITQMRSPAGQLTSYYYDEEGLLFAMQRGTQRYYVAVDPVGTPRLVTDANGTIVKQMEWDAFGGLVSDSAPAFDLPIGFAGGLRDAASGLVNFGFRDYDPASGRWTTRDPARYEGGQFNLYVYVGNNPVQFRDPTGMGVGIGASLFAGIGFEADIMIGKEGISACFGVGVGVGDGLGIKTGDVVARSGLYTSAELTAKFGPVDFSSGFEIDPCGELKGSPLKFTAGPFNMDTDGNFEYSLDPTEWDYTTEAKIQGKLSGKYCATTLVGQLHLILRREP